MPPSKRKARTSGATRASNHLSLYKKSYKGGGKKDLHYAIFQATRELTKARKVFYPGCHRHLTAALIFSDVTFVDCDKKVSPLYNDVAAREYVDMNKIYEEDAQYRFHCCDVQKQPLRNVGKDHDLLISLSAGTIAEDCTPYVLDNGYLLVNDAHSDARMVYTGDNNWELIAFWDDSNSWNTQELDRCFQVVERMKSPTETRPLSRAEAEESVEIGTVRKRSFKLSFEPMFYLFQKKDG